MFFLLAAVKPSTFILKEANMVPGEQATPAT
jgi:hypothetical protein